jgi:hypothetical protein
MQDEDSNPMDKCYTFDLVALESEDGGNSIVYITDKNFSTDACNGGGENAHYLTPSCASEGEFNSQIDRLSEELEILRKEGLKNFERKE